MSEKERRAVTDLASVDPSLRDLSTPENRAWWAMVDRQASGQIDIRELCDQIWDVSRDGLAEVTKENEARNDAMCGLAQQLLEKDAEIAKLSKQMGKAYEDWAIDAGSRREEVAARDAEIEQLQAKYTSALMDLANARMDALDVPELQTTIREAVGLLDDIGGAGHPEGWWWEKGRSWMKRRDAFLARPDIAKLKAPQPEPEGE